MRVARSCRGAAARAAPSWPSDGQPPQAGRVLPEAARLRDSESFRTASRRGRRAGSRTLVVHLLVDPTGGGAATPHLLTSGARVGFVVSKAVGNAVVRNRVKRRLRHQAREQLSSLPGSAVLVVRALPAAAEASYAELGDDLTRCLHRVRA
ncbi:MAG: ribonuclease P protein component [Nocardioides sp.]